MAQLIQANLTHLAVLVPLFDQYRVFYKQKSDEEAAYIFLKNRLEKEEAIIFLAYMNNEAVGFVQLYRTFSSVSLEPFFILNDLYVMPSYRKKGVGEALLNEAKKVCLLKQFKGLALETAADNPAQQLYEKLGWKKQSNLFYFWDAPK